MVMENTNPAKGQTLQMPPTTRPRALTRIGVATLVCALGLTAACNVEPRASRVLFGGHYFPTKAAALDKKTSLADFSVRINDVSQSVDDAREAGRFAGTRYCINNFGSSKIDWKVGPDSDASQLRVSDDKLTFNGTCQRP